MRIIGLDWGEVRIGVAVSDPLGITAQPLFSLENNKEFIGKLKELINKYDVGEIVLGYPKQMSGKSGIAASKVEEFSKKITSEVPIKIILCDERLTTKIAQKFSMFAGASRKKKKSFIDAATAGIILQGYIDSRKL
jgi:putative Holliday junction resolvase